MKQLMHWLSKPMAFDLIGLIRMSKRKTLELQQESLRFISEQDGPIERDLKARLIALFHSDNVVTRAYLAAVDYGDLTTYSVALCIRTLSKTDGALVERIGSIFASLFSPEEHLDIIFLVDGQESQLLAVCRPFFRSEDPR